MKSKSLRLLTTSLFLITFSVISSAQNPLIRNQFTADPSGRVFDGKMFVFPSHDIVAREGQGRPGWFCMEDYHVFSSENLTDWTDHGVIVSQTSVPWVDTSTYSMWAPDCIERNGKYYFYFPAQKKSTDPQARRGFGIGVAVADRPEGPYEIQEKPIENVHGIDPNIFIDHDGQAYLYWSMGNLFVAKLKENMLEIEGEPLVIANLPEKGLKEGPYVIERNGIYYLTFPHVENRIERLEYAVGDHPMGPFTMKGVIMDESPMNCWTNHHSLVEYNDQWYLFYHQNAYSPNFDKNRSICLDSLFFNPDGSIQKVIPTHRGVGLSKAESQIQIDRFSMISDQGVKVEFKDTLSPFEGWKTVFSGHNAWIGYHSVGFEKNMKSVHIRAKAPAGGNLEIRLDRPDGPLAAAIKLPENSDWTNTFSKVAKIPAGVHHLYVCSKDQQVVEFDWIQFSKNKK
ncbi:MAG: family 43 glycosylhydrolase [Prolixibacteraceae bacterium]|nr:family 43 glycosylhydrolase [Prolixibacteraceae bacterium]